LLTLKDISTLDVGKLPDDVINILFLALSDERRKRSRSKTFVNLKADYLKNRIHSIKSPHRRRDLTRILDQDWTSIYPDDWTCPDHYVYAHVQPSNKPFEAGGIAFSGVPFYIGKGTGQRAYDLKRNEGHGAELRRLLKAGKSASDIVFIVKSGLTNAQALCLEAKLIYFFGTRFDDEKNGVLVNLTKPPIFRPSS